MRAKPSLPDMSSPELSSKRDILVVDDNAGNLLAIEAALEGLGRHLVFAHSGDEALARLLEHDFALILLDVSMPGMDGFETATLIRGRERNRATPIIFITGVSRDDDAMLRGYDLGAFDYLVKPIRPEILRAKAQVFIDLEERTLELHQAQAQAHERDLESLRQRLETDALERQMKHLVDMDRKKDEFLAILAHELRNPLQPLLSSLEMIEAAPGEPVPERTRQILRRHIHHINRLVDDLLDAARFTSQKLELRRSVVAIDQIVEQAVTQCRPALEEQGHALSVQRAGEHALVDADPVRLIQIVANLITNAARYTPPGGRVEVATAVDRDDVIVRVVDNGRGISPAILPRIFEMFVQERAAADGSGGLGLGLGIVKRLVELHGGRVRGHSDGEGKGSTFVVRLPRAGTAAAEAPADAVTPGKLVALRPLRAIVCDDADDVRELVAELLRGRGHHVTTVSTGAAAVQAILSENPDVAVIDIGLPGMDGYEVARSVRRTIGKDMLRLIAMTAYGQSTDRAAALAAGFDAHIIKPATVDTLLDAMRDEPGN
jgi:signal transduction histidine kinase